MGNENLLKKVCYRVSSDSDLEDYPSKFSFSSHASSSRQSNQDKVRKSTHVLNSKTKKLKFDKDGIEEFERVCVQKIKQTNKNL